MKSKDGFSLLFYIAHSLTYQNLIKKLFKRKDLDTTADLVQVLYFLATQKRNHKYFKILINKHKDLINKEMKEYLKDSFLSGIEYNSLNCTPLKSYLYYLYKVEGKISKKEVKKLHIKFKYTEPKNIVKELRF